MMLFYDGRGEIMKIFDIHAHIFPDPIALKATDAISHFYDDEPMRGDGRLSTLLEMENAAGVTAFAAHSVATTPHQVDSINRFVMASAAAHPDKIVPFAALHPDVDDLEGTIEGIIAAGFKGIKLHPEFQHILLDEPKTMRLFEIVDGRLPVLTHCGDYRLDNSSPARVKNVMRAFPRQKLICAHLGGWTVWLEAAKQLAGQADVWVDTSSSLYAVKPQDAARIIHDYGVERTLFGVDFPMWSPSEELARFMALPLTDAEREKILWTNHIDLLGGEI